MGNIILLDLISLNYIDPYLLSFHAYLYTSSDFIFFNLDYFTLFQESNGSSQWILENFFYLDSGNSISLARFFLSLEESNYYSLTFLFIYLFILIISIIDKIKLYLELKLFLKNFMSYVRTYRLENLSIYVSYIYWNFIYLILFYRRKNTWNRLNFRSLELKNKKNPEYHQYQYIKFFYVKLMFDIFFSIILRLMTFFTLFLLRMITFLSFNFLSLFFSKVDLHLILAYLSMYRDLWVKSLTSLNFFKKTFSLINYFKIEFFIYFFNDRSFLGGLIYYIYNAINNRIGIFYNSNNWENVEFRSSNYLIRIYEKINPRFQNYNFQFFSRININYIYIFLNIPILIFYLISKFWSNFLKSIKYQVLYYDLIVLKYNIHRQWKIFFLVIFSFYLSFNLTYPYVLLYLFILAIYYFINFQNLNKFNSISGDFYFYYLGYFVIYLFDIFKNFFYYSYLMIIHLLLKLKYLLFLMVLYKLGIFYLLNLGFLNLISNYLEFTAFIFLNKILYVLLDYYNLRTYCSHTREFNHQLVNIMTHDFLRAEETLGSYLHNSFLNRIYTLNFRSIDLSRLSWGAFVEYQRSATRQITARKYYFNLFMEFLGETLTFFVISKNYFLFKFFKFYYIFLFRYSDFNLYYYFFKKIYTIVYLFYIYLYFYLKWLYFYFVPLYLMPKSFIPTLAIIYTILYLYVFKFYFIFSNLRDLSLTNFFTNGLRFLYLLTFLRAFIFYLITFVYYLVYDLIFLFTSLKITIHYPNNPLEWCLNYSLNKSFFRENLKDLLDNYFRIPKKNLINFNLNESLILGGKLRSVSLLDIDNLNMKKVKEAGLMVHQLDDFLIASKPEIKHNRIFKNRDNLLVFNDIYSLFFIYYPDDHVFGFYLREQWIINFFLKKLIIHYLIDLYFFYYLFFFILFYYLFKDNSEKLNINVDQMWINLKDEFDFKLLNNNNLFIKALNYYQKNTGKRKKISKLWSNLQSHWILVTQNYFKNIGVKSTRKKISRSLTKYILLGKWRSYAIFGTELRNFFLEKNLYYNNKFLFYWKNYIFFDKDNKFFQKYDKDNQFLYFFLSLIFRKNRYSSLIFFYFDTLNKMYFYNNGLSFYINKTYDISRAYFEKLDSTFFQGRGPSWLLQRDQSLVLYRDESSTQSDMYSLNFNIIIPYFEKLFFWCVIIIYLYITKFHWRLTPQVDFLGRINRMIYLQSMIINDNFLYFYNLSVYWVNAYFMFDVKHFSYEYGDFPYEWSKNRRYFKQIRRSASFLVNNDPLFYHKKNYSYHLLWLNKYYDIHYSSYSIGLINLIRKLFVIIFLWVFSIKLIFKRRTYSLLLQNNNFNILWYLLYFYNKNILNLNGYWNYYYRKILSNLEMKSNIPPGRES